MMTGMLARRSSSLFVLVSVLAAGCGSDHSTATGGSGGSSPTAGAAGSAAVGGALGGNSGGGFPAGGASAAPGAGGGSAGGACHQSGEACVDSRDCCDGSTCNNTAQAVALNGCHPRCTQNSDCPTGCCVLYTGDTRGICAEALWCTCGAAGAQCGSNQPKCCDGEVCLASNAQQSAYACRKQCTTNADCPTNCCVAIPNLNSSACLDPMYCPAAP